MPRAIWSGAVSFGLVNVPVKLYGATQQKDVSFNQFQAGTGERIRYKRVAEESGQEVDWDDIVKGYEIDKGRYVMVTPEELESIEPGQTRTIDIEDFVDLDEIDPIYYEKTYYLAPEKGRGSEKAYALLRDALRETNKVGIARFVMRSKQYLAAVRPVGDILVLETMFFPDEVRSPSEIGPVPDDVELTDRERSAAERLIESLTTKWEPDRYDDTYRERVLDLIERKAEGEEVVVERGGPPQTNVVDLMAALEASIGRAKQQNGEDSKAGADGKDSKAYADWSKDDLYEEAQRRNIGGRSKMTRDELVEALSESQAS